MARRDTHNEMQKIYQTDNYVRIFDDSLRQQFGVSIRYFETWEGRKCKEKLYRQLREWLDDEDRPGTYAFMCVHEKSSYRKPDEPPHLRIYASDENLRFEIMLRYV